VPLQEFFEKWGFEGLKALRPNEGGGQKPGKSGANCRTRGADNPMGMNNFRYSAQYSSELTA
jgi:hypothetical protein